jgi:hypothetical protein
MKPIHHTTEMKECCVLCGKPFLMMWYDAEEKNGRSETRHGHEGKQKHSACIEKETGRPPLSLSDINDMRSKNMSQDQYYKSKGY